MALSEGGEPGVQERPKTGRVIFGRVAVSQAAYHLLGVMNMGHDRTHMSLLMAFMPMFAGIVTS